MASPRLSEVLGHHSPNPTRHSPCSGFLPDSTRLLIEYVHVEDYRSTPMCCSFTEASHITERDIESAIMELPDHPTLQHLLWQDARVFADKAHPPDLDERRLNLPLSPSRVKIRNAHIHWDVPASVSRDLLSMSKADCADQLSLLYRRAAGYISLEYSIGRGRCDTKKTGSEIH